MSIETASTLFIVGCARSGTTAMVSLLNEDPRFLLGNEAFKKVPRLRRAALTLDPVLASLEPEREEELRARAASSTLRYFGTKSPKSYKRLKWLAREFADAKFLYMVRDLEPVASSWNVRARVKKNWPAIEDYERAVGQWNDAMSHLVRYQKKGFADRIFPVRYEWFYSGDRAYLDAMLRFLEVEPSAALVEAWEASCERWSQLVQKELLLDDGERAYLREHRDADVEDRALELCARRYLRYGDVERIGDYAETDSPVVLGARLDAATELTRLTARLVQSHDAAARARKSKRRKLERITKPVVDGLRAAVRASSRTSPRREPVDSER